MKISFFVTCLITIFQLCYSSEEEYRLLQDLKENYDPVERPVENHSLPIDVHLRIILQQIVDVDERNQVLTLVVWTQMSWIDYKMRWSPKEYSNIYDVNLPPDMLWKPDILLFNSADENFDSRFPVNFVVQYTGHVLQVPPAIIKSSCEIDITWFPFDEQLCYLKYGSWTHTGKKLQLFIDDTGLKDSLDKMDLKYFVLNGEWELIATPAIRKVSDFGDNVGYNELFFYMHIKRKIIYYGMNWIIPSILFLLSNVLGFTMPAECGEKITLQTTNLLSVTVFLGMVADVTPPTSTSVPIIAAFFSISMIILGSSIIFTLLIINVHFRSSKTHKMSPWMRTIFLEWLPWLLLMNRPGEQFKNPKKQKKKNFTDSTYNIHNQLKQALLLNQPIFNDNKKDSINSIKIGYEQNFISSKINKNDYCNLTINPIEKISLFYNNDKQNENKKLLKLETILLLQHTLYKLNDFLQNSQTKMNEEEEEERTNADWRFMAIAINRACLYFYAFLSAIIPIWMLTSTPKPLWTQKNIENFINYSNSSTPTY